MAWSETGLGEGAVHAQERMGTAKKFAAESYPFSAPESSTQGCLNLC